jgi:hypothetical protein
MALISIYHGSKVIIKNPIYHHHQIINDYGQGFYTTNNRELAKEWAVKNKTDGYANEYSLDTASLKILNLLDGNYTLLHWIALLLKNRHFDLSNPLTNDARNYLLKHYLIDTKDYDIIIGYRADDSYFAYAQAFLESNLSLRVLNEALYLGKLGMQIVLVSEIAFKNIKFIKAIFVDKNIYFTKYVNKDLKARQDYYQNLTKVKSYQDDIFMLDILRKEIKIDDPRLQRVIFK